MDRPPNRYVPAQSGKLCAALIERLINSVTTQTKLQVEGVRPTTDLLDVPKDLEYLWIWFWELEQSRQAAETPLALRYGEILAWAQLTDIQPRRWELRAIMAMDTARRMGLMAKPEDDNPDITQRVDWNDKSSVQSMLRSCAPKEGMNFV